MGLFSFLWRLFGGGSTTPVREHNPQTTHGSSQQRTAQAQATKSKRTSRLLKRLKLSPLRYAQRQRTIDGRMEISRSKQAPYKFARPSFQPNTFYDLSQDVRQQLLASRGLPVLSTPADLAAWLEIPLGKLAWLVNRFTESGKPVDLKQAHYHFRWLKKRKRGYRLLEIPKESLRIVQDKILTDILQLVKPHPSARGFHPGSSIKQNAVPHLGREILLKYDLENFYPRMRFSRVVAVYRTLGYSRETSIWLAILCTSATPNNLATPVGESVGIITPYTSRHLPQGAPTSPALANLCAFSLDVRLQGLAKKFKVNYTRYADDLTFSGDQELRSRLRVFIRLTEQIIKQERFTINKAKRKVARSSQRQVVTGVVVNEKLNCMRAEYDRLKATLHNCVRFGAATQNREAHTHFAEHLLGRISSISNLNAQRGEKLLAIYNKISW